MGPISKILTTDNTLGQSEIYFKYHTHSFTSASLYLLKPKYVGTTPVNVPMAQTH
jgi:hypothetical protein